MRAKDAEGRRKWSSNGENGKIVWYSPTGEFAEHDWVSTDKPQPPRASGSSSARAK